MANLRIVFNGIDDPSRETTENNRIRFASGEVLHGILVLTAPSVPANWLASVQLKLKGTTKEFGLREEHHTRTVSYTDSQGNTHWRTEHYTTYHEDDRIVQFLSRTQKLDLYPLPSPDTRVGSSYQFFYAFSYPLPNDLEQSYATPYSGGPFVEYTFKAKVQWRGPSLKAKAKRPLHVAGYLPNADVLSSEGKEIIKKSSYMSGQINLSTATDRASYKEGELVFVVSNVDNNSSKDLHRVVLSLQERCTARVVHRNFSGESTRTHKTRLVQEEVLGVSLDHKQKRQLRLMMAMPSRMCPTTTRLKNFARFDFVAKVRLDVPWGSDIMARCPVVIIPNLANVCRTRPLQLPSYASPYCPPPNVWQVSLNNDVLFKDPAAQGAQAGQPQTPPGYPPQQPPQQPGYPPQQPGYPPQQPGYPPQQPGYPPQQPGYPPQQPGYPPQQPGYPPPQPGYPGYPPPQPGYPPQQPGYPPQQPGYPGYPPQQPGYPPQQPAYPQGITEKPKSPEELKAQEAAGSAGGYNPGYSSQPPPGYPAPPPQPPSGYESQPPPGYPGYSAQPPPTYAPPPYPPPAAQFQPPLTYIVPAEPPPPYEIPKGLYFTIEVVGAVGLPKTDLLGSCDPYVTIWLNENVRCTSIKKGTRSPVWNEKFLFPCLNNISMRFVCWDSNMMQSDELVGSGTLDLTRVDLGADTTHTITFLSPKGKEKGHLTVKLGPPIPVESFTPVTKKEKKKK